MAYRCVTVTATKNDNVLDKIYEILKREDGYFNTKFSVRFIGFEASVGTKFKINNIPNKVPKSGYFITPYDGARYMNINSLYFDDGCSEQDFYIIY